MSGPICIFKKVLLGPGLFFLGLLAKCILRLYFRACCKIEKIDLQALSEFQALFAFSFCFAFFGHPEIA